MQLDPVVCHFSGVKPSYCK